jgi:hypothetical protein
MGRTASALLSAALAVAAAACGETTASPALLATRAQSAGPVFVMEPVWRSGETGNSSRDYRVINADVVARILMIVRERFPTAEVAESRSPVAMPVPPGYPLKVDEGAVSTDEFNAASCARQRGAAYLLVPTIREWKEMRTDDPIGAIVLPHNSVALTLRLMRLQPPGLSGRVEFTNRARLTLNQPAYRLLDGRFREVVLRLVSSAS